MVHPRRNSPRVSAPRSKAGHALPDCLACAHCTGCCTNHVVPQSQRQPAPAPAQQGKAGGSYKYRRLLVRGSVYRRCYSEGWRVYPFLVSLLRGCGDRAWQCVRLSCRNQGSLLALIWTSNALASTLSLSLSLHNNAPSLEPLLPEDGMAVSGHTRAPAHVKNLIRRHRSILQRKKVSRHLRSRIPGRKGRQNPRQAGMLQCMYRTGAVCCLTVCVHVSGVLRILNQSMSYSTCTCAEREEGEKKLEWNPSSVSLALHAVISWRSSPAVLAVHSSGSTG